MLEPCTTDANILTHLKSNLLRDAYTVSMEPFFARVTLNHEDKAIVTSSANAILLIVKVDLLLLFDFCLCSLFIE